MKRFSMIGILLLCVMAVTGCLNNNSTLNDNSTNVQFSAAIENCLRAENDNFLSGLIMLSETAKDSYSHDNILKLKSQLDMFIQTNDLYVSREFINGNVPKDICEKIINPYKKEGFMYRFETLDALRNTLDFLSSRAEISTTEEQLEWYKSFTANIVEITFAYKSVGNDFIGDDNLTYVNEQFDKIHTLNQLLTQSTQLSSRDVNMSDIAPGPSEL